MNQNRSISMLRVTLLSDSREFPKGTCVEFQYEGKCWSYDHYDKLFCHAGLRDAVINALNRKYGVYDNSVVFKDVKIENLGNNYERYPRSSNNSCSTRSSHSERPWYSNIVAILIFLPAILTIIFSAYFDKNKESEEPAQEISNENISTSEDAPRTKKIHHKKVVKDLPEEVTPEVKTNSDPFTEVPSDEVNPSDESTSEDINSLSF